MTIAVACPGCKVTFNVPSELAGGMTKCRFCSTEFCIPPLVTLVTPPITAISEGPIPAPKPTGFSVDRAAGIADQIDKLHELLCRGAINQEEYDQAKRSILAGSRRDLVANPQPANVVVSHPPINAVAPRQSSFDTGVGLGCGWVIGTLIASVIILLVMFFICAGLASTH